MNKTAYITHPICHQHDNGVGHPESPERLKAIDSWLKETGINKKLINYQAPLVDTHQLNRVHTTEHLALIENKAPAFDGDRIKLEADTSMSYHSLEAAKRAAGAVIFATDLVMNKKVNNAFCAVRPPGHHAKRDSEMGFCLYNNIMVGVYHALANGIERVALLDFDVHHGNGSEQIIADDERVLFCSSFQYPFYPHEPFAENHHIICSPLALGSGSKEFREEVENNWIPALEKFKPKMIFISAGFDAHKDDLLAGLNLTEADYFWVTQKIMTIADEYASGRLVSSLEGGYNPDALAKSVETHLLALLNESN